jgi:alpha-mannosidase
VTGVKDTSPAGNVNKPASLEFAVQGPVYTLAQVTPEQMGTTIRDVPGLPVKAGDSWTLNMFVKMDKQPPNRTIIAGFGNCEQAEDGGARYLAKFPSGVHFWSHNRDIATRTALDLGRWQMLTATYDGGVLRLYKDGVKIGERAAVLADDRNVVSLAPKDPWEKQRQFEGEIRGLTIWTSALPEEAIATLKKDEPRL